ncbi:hypothetical protein F5B20DRAFT_57845 [Whalleya microplaca]|nr:hypothetical protein F5B20DRAFT_57845 [Whalleya microplaca]
MYVFRTLAALIALAFFFHLSPDCQTIPSDQTDHFSDLKKNTIGDWTFLFTRLAFVRHSNPPRHQIRTHFTFGFFQFQLGHGADLQVESRGGNSQKRVPDAHRESRLTKTRD